MQAFGRKTRVNLDIFVEILSHLRPDRKTVRSLALVSRRFCDLALDILWRQLDDVLPLFRLVEGERWAIHDVCCRTDPCFCAAMREIPEADWTRFLAYARRVHVVGIALPEYEGRMDNRTLLALVLRAGGWHVFPSLVSLEMTLWCAADYVLFLFLSGCLYTSPATNGLVRGILLGHSRLYAFPLSTLLDRNALQVAPMLKLTLAGKSHMVLDAVRGFGGLIQVDIINGMPTALWLRTLAKVKRLCDLRFSFRGYPPLNRPFVFRYLERLDIAGDPRALFDLFRNLSVPRLNSLTIRLLYCKDLGFLNSFSEALEMLPASLRSTLGTLKIDAHSADDGANTPSAYFADLFGAILRLSALANLSVNMCFYIVLSDLDVCAMATAFPRLELLELEWPLRSNNGMPSVFSLGHFARKCPRLRGLVIPRLACRCSSSRASGDVRAQLQDVPAHGLEYLSFEYGMPRDPTPVGVLNALRAADFIYRTFPDAEIDFDCDNPTCERVVAPVAHYFHRMVRLLARARQRIHDGLENAPPVTASDRLPLPVVARRSVPVEYYRQSLVSMRTVYYVLFNIVRMVGSGRS